MFFDWDCVTRRPTVWDCVLKILCMNVIINVRLRSMQAQLGTTILRHDLIIVRHDNGWLLERSTEERRNRPVQREIPVEERRYPGDEGRAYSTWFFYIIFRIFCFIMCLVFDVRPVKAIVLHIECSSMAVLYVLITLLICTFGTIDIIFTYSLALGR